MQPAAFGYIRQMVKQQAGIIVEPGKEYLAESRLGGFARELGFATLDLFVETLRVSPFGESHRRVIELLTTNETSFFRDSRAFEALRQTLIPQLLAARPGRNLVIWCAASSSGQEPYSVAMLLREYFPALSTTRIIASDISRDMLARTRDGTYSPFEIGRGVSPALLAKYFVPNGARWQLRPELRAMIETREINLAMPFPALPAIDILLVRNVLIYFDAPTKQEIMTRMRKVLARDGILMLGGAETALGVDAGFDRCTADNKAVWYCSR